MCVEVVNVFYFLILWENNDICVNCACTCYTAKKAGLNWFELVNKLKHTQLCAIEFTGDYFHCGR